MRSPVHLWMVVSVITLFLCGLLFFWSAFDTPKRNGTLSRRTRWKSFLGVGSAVVVGVGGPMVPAPAITVPVSDVVAPAVALSLLRRILRVRRSQMLTDPRGDPPRRLTGEEMQTLSMLVRASQKANAQVTETVPDETTLTPEVRELMNAVDEVRPSPAPQSGKGEWVLLVRLIGEPRVQNRSGETATFGKRKSMELLSWMVLNRDRSTRSAARTALWEMDVASSTFSTIMSDLRRGLRNLSSGIEFTPSTHTDSLPLSGLVTTDVELLERAMETGSLTEIGAALELVRDMPFAGTDYLWADLDGSTTRIVMTVMRAVSTAIDLASDSGQPGMIATAVRAGLRVMPGDENLLAIQRTLCTSWRP